MSVISTDLQSLREALSDSSKKIDGILSIRALFINTRDGPVPGSPWLLVLLRGYSSKFLRHCRKIVIVADSRVALLSCILDEESSCLPADNNIDPAGRCL